MNSGQISDNDIKVEEKSCYVFVEEYGEHQGNCTHEIEGFVNEFQNIIILAGYCIHESLDVWFRNCLDEKW